MMRRFMFALTGLLLLILLACGPATAPPDPTGGPKATTTTPLTPTGATATTTIALTATMPLSATLPLLTATPVPTQPPQATPIPTTIPPTRTQIPIPATRPAVESVTVDVYVILFDPDVKGLPLTQQYGYADPHGMMSQFIQDIEVASGGSVHYRVAKESVVKTWPKKTDGYVFTGDEYWACEHDVVDRPPAYCETPVDYPAFLNTAYDSAYMSACDAVVTQGIDEIWQFEGGWFGFLEFNRIPPHTLCPQVSKPFTVMAFSYSRAVTEMLHNIGHRMERGVQDSIGVEQWDRFDGQRNRYWQDYAMPPAPDEGHPEVNASQSHCGNVHFTPNAYAHYQSDRNFMVQSNCDQWVNYPNVAEVYTPLNCDTWGCNHYGYMKWWLGHVPHNAGQSSGIHHNWWKYIYVFDGT